jgi:excisionase family DNA binding protein
VGSESASNGRDRQLTCRQAAAKLGVCEKTLRRYLKAGRVRFHRLPGGHFRIPESAIAEFFSEHEGRRAHTAPAGDRRRRPRSTRRPTPPPASGRRPRLGSEPDDDYDLSPAALAELRAQFR